MLALACALLAGCGGGGGGLAAPTGLAPLGAPGDLQAVANGPDEIRIAWTDRSSAEEGFELERSSVSATSGFNTLVVVGAGLTGFLDRGVAASTRYWYRVRATSAAGDSAWSNVAEATTALWPLEPPTDLVATVVGPMELRLTWTDRSSGEQGFELQRSSVSASEGFAVVSLCAANATAFSDGGVAPATSYWYRVRAFSGQVVSPWSNVAGNVTPGTPPAPAGLAATAAGSFHVNVNWLSTAVYHTGFEVERSFTCSSTGFALVATVGPAETHAWDTVPTAQVTYCYRVRATSLAGPSDWSQEAQVLMPPWPPPDLKATATGPTTVDLSWGGTPGPGITFDVQYRQPAAASWIDWMTTNWIIATVGGLAPSATYEFRVFAAAAGGRSDPSAVATATTLPGP